MRVKAMRLPENLALDDVADVVSRLGAPTDRTSVARALRDVVIRGVKEPETPRGRWRIPRSKLHECVGACLLRREVRQRGWRDLSPEAFVWLAAQSMLEDAELEKFVPRRLKAEILEEQRLEEERRLKAERKARREAKAAERRARELEERREFSHVRYECYWRFRYSYLRAFWSELRVGKSDWKVEQEKTFDREWPREMPKWWLPPPEMHEAMKAFLRRRDATPLYLDLDVDVPGWQEWLPPYQFGMTWPWRREVE